MLSDDDAPDALDTIADETDTTEAIGTRLEAMLTAVLNRVRDGVTFCAVCGNVSDDERCRICSDPRRDASLVCVVEEPKDVQAVERTREFRGRYHVLGGALDPLSGVGPEQLRIRELLNRIADAQAAGQMRRIDLEILDGALATELERRGADLRDALWSARLLIEQPELIRAVHLDYFRAGADVATSASYQATFDGFARRGLDTEAAAALMRRSVELAQEARAQWLQERPASDARPTPLVAASVGPYGAMKADGSEYRGDYGLDEEALMAFHRPRLAVLKAAGADLIFGGYCEVSPAGRRRGPGRHGRCVGSALLGAGQEDRHRRTGERLTDPAAEIALSWKVARRKRDSKRDKTSTVEGEDSL